VRRKFTIGRAELEILRYIAERRPITVRAVAEHFAETRGLARTTALTVMERLRRKGYLTRRKVGGAYEYLSSLPKEELQQEMIGDFVERALGGSVSPLVAYISQLENLTDEELRGLKQMVINFEERGEKKPSGRG
jgi:predicted transcriptional regulator